MSRHFLSKRDIKKIREDLESIPIGFSDIEHLEIEESGKFTVYFYKRKPFFFRTDRLIPTLFLLNTLKPEQNRITVDNGAVPHVAKGSGIFIRGITGADHDISEGDMVFVKNLDNVYISVGISNCDTETLLSKKDGEGIQNIHHLGDELMKNFSS